MAKDGKHLELQDKLTDVEKRELEAILDRLSVQNPNGESFMNWLESLKNAFSNRQRFVAALLDVISKSPTETGKKVFLALKDSVRDKELRKIVRKAEYRMIQKGALPKEPYSQSEKVVLFSDKLKNINIEERGEAHLWILPLSGLCAVSLYIPSLTDESRSVFAGIDIKKWSRVFLGKTLGPDKIPQVMVEFGGKRVYRELTSIIASTFGIISVSVSPHLGALLAAELIEIFSEYNTAILSSRNFDMAKDVVNSLFTDDPNTLWMRELGFSPGAFDHSDETMQAFLAKSIETFWFDPKIMVKTSEALLTIVDSVLTWDQALKEYHAKRKLVEFFSSVGELDVKLYRFLLKSSAVMLAKQKDKNVEAQALFSIAQDIGASSFNRWESFLVTHISRSFASFAKFKRQLEEQFSSSGTVTSSLVVVPGEENKQSRWTLLEEFLTGMTL